MKKFLLSLAAVALTSGFAMADDLLYNLEFGSASTTGECPKTSAYTATYSYEMFSGEVFIIKNFNNNNNGWSDMIKCGRKGNASTGSITTDFSVADPVTSVVLEISKFNESGMVNEFTLQTSADNQTWTTVATAQESDYTDGTITLTDPNPAPNLYYRVNIDCASAKNNGVVWLTGMKYYGKASVSTKEPAGLAFPASSFSVGMGQDFTKGTLENPNKLNVTWASSDEAVATVDQEGFVVVKGIGTTIISVDSEETETYAAGHAQYSLTVVPAATTLPQMLQAAPEKGDKVLVIGELYVIFASGQYVYVKDMFDNAGLLYGTNNYAAGDVIPGEWEATNAIYNDVIEWSGSFPGAAANNPNYVTYETVQSVTAADLNKVVLIKGVQFPDGTPAAKAGVTVTLPDGTEILVHNQFSLEEMPAGTYNLVAAVTIYKGAVQLYAIEYQTASAVEPTFPESLNITTNAEGIIIEQGWKSDGYNVKITGESPEAVLVNFETPEGYDGIFIMGDVEVDDSVSPFRAAEEAEWMPLSYFQSYGSMGNTVELPLSKYSDYFDIYLVWNDMVDYANSITVTYKITEANTDGVEAIEAAEAEAEYYTLQGVKVANPTEGIYVKVANGKATKVVL